MTSSRSTARRSTAPARRTAEKARPDLRVVDADAVTRRRRQRRFLVLVGVVFLAGCLVVAAAQASLVTSQRELDDVRRQIIEAEGQRDRLRQELVDARSPETIIARAVAMGMVRADDPVYLVAVREADNGGDVAPVDPANEPAPADPTTEADG